MSNSAVIASVAGFAALALLSWRERTSGKMLVKKVYEVCMSPG